MDQSDEILWYAMRVTYRRELKVRQMLAEAGIENYIPMKYTRRVRYGHKEKLLEPVVRGVVFVHASQAVIQAFKSTVPYFQYIVNRLGEKIIVPEKQMRLFIAVTGTYDEHLLWFGENEINLSRGTRVRICGGEFEGYEGVFLKVKGTRDKRVVIAIEGVIAVALATISPDLIQVI